MPRLSWPARTGGFDLISLDALFNFCFHVFIQMILIHVLQPTSTKAFIFNDVGRSCLTFWKNYLHTKHGTSAMPLPFCLIFWPSCFARSEEGRHPQQSRVRPNDLAWKVLPNEFFQIQVLNRAAATQLSAGWQPLGTWSSNWAAAIGNMVFKTCAQPPWISRKSERRVRAKDPSPSTPNLIYFRWFEIYWQHTP